MSQRNGLLQSIATTLADYRAGELPAPTPDHLDRWIRQFSEEAQINMLVELDHVFKNTYINRESAVNYLRGLLHSDTITGGNHCDFWRNVNFLNIQLHGNSQKDYLDILNELLTTDYGYGLQRCGSEGGPFIYVDDILFSGNRIGNDLENWIVNTAPSTATVHIIVNILHTSGEWLTKNRLQKVMTAAKKNIEIHYWRAKNIENRKGYKDDSEVLWPAVLPESPHVQVYVQEDQKFPFVPRNPGGTLGPFSSEQGRQLLEREFVLSGLYIRSLCRNPKKAMRPLGFSPFGLGFGSMTVTFRNCPNNCPLALWWGDPTAHAGSPLSKWYPLVPRNGY